MFLLHEVDTHGRTGARKHARLRKGVRQLGNARGYKIIENGVKVAATSALLKPSHLFLPETYLGAELRLGILEWRSTCRLPLGKLHRTTLAPSRAQYFSCASCTA